MALLLGGLVACSSSTVDVDPSQGGTTEASDDTGTTDGSSASTTGPLDGTDSSSGDPGPPLCELSDDVLEARLGTAGISSENTCVPGETVHTSDEAGIPVTTITLHCGEDPADPTGPDITIRGYWVDFGSEAATFTKWNVTYETAGNHYLSVLHRGDRVLAMNTNWASEWGLFVDVAMVPPEVHGEACCVHEDECWPRAGLRGTAPDGTTVEVLDSSVIHVVSGDQELLARLSSWLTEDSDPHLDVIDADTVVR